MSLVESARSRTARMAVNVKTMANVVLFDPSPGKRKFIPGSPSARIPAADGRVSVSMARSPPLVVARRPGRSPELYWRARVGKMTVVIAPAKRPRGIIAMMSTA